MQCSVNPRDLLQQEMKVNKPGLAKITAIYFDIEIIGIILGLPWIIMKQ